MAKFECETCGEKLELASHTIKVLDGKVISPEAICCDQYMKGIRENKGGKNGLTTD